MTPSPRPPPVPSQTLPTSATSPAPTEFVTPPARSGPFPTPPQPTVRHSHQDPLRSLEGTPATPATLPTIAEAEPSTRKRQRPRGTMRADCTQAKPPCMILHMLGALFCVRFCICVCIAALHCCFCCLCAQVIQQTAQVLFECRGRTCESTDCASVRPS